VEQTSLREEAEVVSRLLRLSLSSPPSRPRLNFQMPTAYMPAWCAAQARNWRLRQQLARDLQKVLFREDDEKIVGIPFLEVSS